MLWEGATEAATFKTLTADAPSYLADGSHLGSHSIQMTGCVEP